MSKSLGNVLDPFEVMDRFGTDALRYYCFREVSFGQDGGVSTKTFGERYETELANEFGNLANRTLNMLGRYRDSTVPAVEVEAALAHRLRGPRRGGLAAARPGRDHAGAGPDLAARAAAEPLRRGERAVEAGQGRGQGRRAEHRAALAGRGPARADRPADAVHPRIGGEAARPRSARPRPRSRPRSSAPTPAGRPSRSSRPSSRSRSDRQPHPPRSRPRARVRARGAGPRRGRHAHPDDRDGRTVVPRRAQGRRDVSRGLRRGRPPPQRGDRLQRRDHRRAARVRRRTRSCERSARPASTTSATTRRARIRREPSRPRSRSRTRSASR